MSPAGPDRSRNEIAMTEYTTPPIRRYTGPMIDAHMHARPPEQMGLFLDVAEGYGVRTYFAIADLPTIAACRATMGDRLVGVVRLAYQRLEDAETFRRESLDVLRRSVREQNVRGVKFWFKPQFNVSSGLFWDDPRLDHIFEFMIDHRMTALIHIADPDIWYESVYSDATVYGTKLDTYRQLENRMNRFPDLQVQAAHLGGHPEDLDHLQQMLDDHPNLAYDLSATKWLARELSRKPEASREFVIRNADRLLWGTDLVVGRRADMTADDYATRYYVHRHLWEGAGPMVSPIHDADAGREVTVQGLDLPDDVLEKIYVRNAERVYRIRAAE